MKKSIYLLVMIPFFISCTEVERKDYVTLSGIIKNPNSDSLIVAQRTIIKTIKVDGDGKFLDTLKIEPGNYVLFDGREQAAIYLENGYDLHITLDTEQFDETLKFEGIGHETNNYLSKKSLMIEKELDFEKMMSLDEAHFNSRWDEIERTLNELLKGTKGLDSMFIASQEKETLGLKDQIVSMYTKKQALNALKGKISPQFMNYENHLGSKTSLVDLRGKYVYIDIWATWCGPCKREIPFLKELEKKYGDGKVEFVSISVDQNKDRDKWKQMIEDEELGGIQLFADKSWESAFIKDYDITGIPRFILIDPDGKVVSADAPRPSDGKLVDLFNTLNI